MVGRADVLHPHPVQSTARAVQDIIDTLLRFLPNTAVFIAAPIPHREDPQQIVKDLMAQVKMVRNICKTQNDVEFTKVAADFVIQGRVNKDMYSNIDWSQKAIDIITKSIIAKQKAEIITAKFRY